MTESSARQLPALTRFSASMRSSWPEDLANFVEGRRLAPFAWGANDCVTFAFDAVQAMTGEDAIAALRGAWSGEFSAQRVLSHYGGLESGASAILGAPVRGQQAAMVRRGAMVCVGIGEHGEGRPTLGICLGAATWCAPGEAGLVFRPMREVAVAWVL